MYCTQAKSAISLTLLKKGFSPTHNLIKLVKIQNPLSLSLIRTGAKALYNAKQDISLLLLTDRIF